MAAKKKTAKPISSFDDLDSAGIGVGYQPFPADPVATMAAPAPDRTLGTAAKDSLVQMAEGVNTTLGAVPGLFAPDSGMAGFFKDGAQYWRDKQSEPLKERIAGSDQRIQEAGKEGVMSQIGTAAAEYWNDPAQAARLVFTNLPSMAATLGTGAAAGLAAKGVAAARGLSAAKEAALVAQYGTRTAMATNAALNAGGARGEAYEDLKRAALAQGMSPEQAEQAALSGSILPGVVGGVAGAVSGKVGLEKALLGQAGTGVGTALRRSAGAFGAELAGEQIEEVAPKLTTNYEAGKIDPARSLTDDLGRTVVETAIGAGPGAIVAGGVEGMSTPAKEAADTIRNTEKLPESGALTKALNAGVEAKAQAVEAGAPVDGQIAPNPAPDPVDDPVRDQILALPDGARQDALRAYAVVNRTDVAKGVQQYNRKLLDRLLAENAPPPALGESLTGTDMGTMLGGGGMAGNTDPLMGALGMGREAQANSITNVANVAERRPPMPASDAARMLDEARNRGLDLAVAEHPAGGFVLVPPNWVTPDMAAQGEARLNETIARMQQADAAPVERAQRTSTEPVDLSLPTDPVQNYMDTLRTVNTPAAQAFVRDFDAGRITPADVQQRMVADQGKTPDQRIAQAAAEAPAQTDPVADRLARAAAQGAAVPAPTDILNPVGLPFKTRMAADRAAKQTTGVVVPVEGGFVVRPQESVNVQDVPQAPEVPQAAPAVSQPAQAQEVVGAQPAGPAAGVPAEGVGAVEAAGVGGATLYEQRKAKRGSSNQNQAETPVEQAPDAATASRVAKEAQPFENRFVVKDDITGARVEWQALNPAGGWKVQTTFDNIEAATAAVASRGIDPAGVSVWDSAWNASAKRFTPAKKREADRQDAEMQASAATAAPQAEAAPEPAAEQELNRPEAPANQAPEATENVANDSAGQDEKAIRYELPPEKYAQQQGNESWMAAQSPSFKPTARQQLLMDAVAKALDDGAFYNSDVDEHVAKALGVTLEQRARNSRGVEGGDFGFDVYNASRAVQAQRSNAKSREFAKALNLKPGDVLGTLVFNDGKVTTGVKVNGLNDSGLVVTVTGKRGAATLNGEVGIDGLAAAMDRAKERGKRKDGYAEFVAGRGAVQPSLPAPATHADPGQAPEVATPAVVTDSLKKAARNEDTKPSEMRKWLVAEIDKELLQAADRPDYDEAVKRLGEKDAISGYTGNGPFGKNNETGYITFDVPGDGKYKVRNSVRGLLEFRKNVMASQGFKDSGQKRAKPDQNDGVQGGSGGNMAAITNMIEEGDFEAARDYAEAVGVSLDDVKVLKGERKTEWEMFRKTGFVPRLPDTRPQPAPKTAAQLDEEKRQAAEAEEKRPKDTGWNMAGTGYGGKRYIGRNITLEDGREVVARVYENAGTYEEAEVKVDGVRKFAVTDRENAQDKADAFIKTLTAGDDAPSQVVERAATPSAAIPDGYKPAGEPFYRGGKQIQGYAPFAPGERVTMKDSAGQSGVIESLASPDDSGVFASAVVKFDNGMEQMVQFGKLEAPAAQPDTPKLTPAEAKSLMVWEDLGQKDGVKTHALTFYESQADKDAKRGRMIVAKVSKGDRSATAWMVDGEDKTFGMLAQAKKLAEEVGMAKAVADGFVQEVNPFAEYDAVAKQYGYEVRPDGMIGKDGKFPGPKMAIKKGRMRVESSAGNLLGSYSQTPASIGKFLEAFWYAEKPAQTAEKPAPAANPAAPKADTVPLSSVIDKMNAKNGQGLTDADRVPEQKPASKTPTIDRHNATMAAVREGKATAEQFRASFEQVVDGKAAIVAELDTMTKVQLLREGGPFVQMRYANEKKADVVDAVYREMVGEYALGESVTYGMGRDSYQNAVRKLVEATDADKLAQYVNDRQYEIAEAQARGKARAAALENPKTRDDFRNLLDAHMRTGKTRKESFLMLTPDQRIQYDTLEAESTREARETRKRAQKSEVRAAGQTTAGEIVATKHTRDGYDLFVVKLADRLSKEDYSTVLASAKKLGGWYSAFRGNGAIPGFQFKDKANAEAFLALAGGDTTAAQEQVAQRRDAFEDDRSQTAVERLRAMADKLEEGAAEVEGQQRKTNTERRARFASAALQAAAADKAKAQTMRNIAQAIEDGKSKFLDAIRTKSQVDMLTSIVDTAKGAELRAKYPSYADQEKRKGEPPTAETADFADFPSYSAFRSDLATLGRQLLEVDGTKKLGQRLMSVADDVTDAYLEFAKANFQDVSRFGRGDALAEFASKDEAERAIKRSGLTGKAIVLPIKRGQNRVILSPSEAIGRGLWQGDGDKRITLTAEFGAELVEAIGRRGNKQNQLSVPWQFQNAYDRRKALSRIGIETPSEFRAALREFIGLKEQAVANRTRELELQMVGRKADGLDFFPTSAEVADQMIEAADLTPDMAVLEPSAGMGHLADRIREAGAEPDVIEISADRRALLEEKGYITQAVDDFLDLKPREFYTFGDTFRAPDGAEGIMRGANGNRVRLVNQAGDMVGAGYYDRADLTGVAHNGTASGYDRIIMNPPFSNRRDAEHVRHAYSLLKPGGRIVAIMGEGVFFGQDKKAQDFREWLESVGGTSEKLPEGSFMDPSLPVNTSVNARMVVIDKPAGAPAFSRVPAGLTAEEAVAMFNAASQVPPDGRSAARRLSDERMAAAERMVAGLKQRWAEAPEIIVARNMQDEKVPQAVRDHDTTLKSQGATGEARGFIYKGEVYLLSDQLKGPQQIAEVLFHEVLGHYGLRGAFGDALTPILKQIAALRRADVQAKAKEYGLDMSKEADRLQAAEEVLAEMAQTKPELGYVKRAIAAFRTWLRANVPGLRGLALSDAEIIQKYLLPARGFVERGRVASGAAVGALDPAFSLGAGGMQSGGLAPMSPSPAKTPLYEAFRQLARFGDAFQLQGSTAKDIADIALDMQANIPDVEQYTAGDSTALHRGVRKKTLALYIQGMDGSQHKLLDIFEADSDRPFVVIGNSEVGQDKGGAHAYQIAFAWAHNNGKTMRPDPAGLTVINRLRRSEAMISSALRFGTTRHLEPHADQFIALAQTTRRLRAEPEDTHYSGNPQLHGELEALKEKLWTPGKGADTIANNVQHLIEASAQLARLREPALRDLEIVGGALRNRLLETSIPLGDIASGAQDATRTLPGVTLRPASTGVGRTTAVRYAVAASVARAISDGRAAPAGTDAQASGVDSSVDAAAVRAIGQTLGRLDRGTPAGLSGVLYSRTDSGGASMADAAGAAIKAISATNIKKRAGFKLTDYLGVGLQALGRRQIVDIYGDMLPLAEYNRLVQQMEADKNEGGAEADQLVTQWAKLPDEGKLADLMHDATLAQIDPAAEFVDGDDKAQYLSLQRKYNLLSDEAKKVYADTRDAYKAHHAKVRSAIKERIERSEIKGERKAALLKQMDDEFFAAVKGVYFPLARFGQYAVTVKGPDGKVESVSRAETKAEADALRNGLLAAFPRNNGFTVSRVMLSKEFVADRDAVGRGFMTELYQVLDKQDMDAVQRAELEDTLGQLYLSSLPDLSWAKHGIHRKGTPGFSQDARRAFAQNMFHGARYLAKLRYSDLMQDELTAMQKHVDDWREVEDFDQNSAQRVVDEMNKRHESLMNPKSNPLSTALTSFGFVFHLGLSPASAMVNLSQTALVAYPIMGAKWGFGKASAALLKASAEATKGKNDITGSLNADERAAYDEAVRAGTIDVTMAHDLAGIAQGEDAGVMWKIRPVMRWASFLFHHAERFNRQVTFVAAYRLARDAGADHKAAFEQATKATYDGHYDYSAANRPRIMQGNVAKVLLLFKQYGQNMVYTLARNAQQAMKAETPEARTQARKALGGLLTSHAMAAGVLGLPMVTTLLAAASMIGGDDDEPWDAKVALQNMLADTFGQKPAEVLAHGLSRLTPWDISGRVGLDRLIFPDVQEGLEGQRLWESAATQALGPVGGIAGGALKGLDLMSDGHYKLGLEAMLPAVLRQAVKSVRYATDGAQDKSGVSIKDEVSTPAVVGQLLGFSPSDVRLAQEGKSAVYQQDRALGERRQELLTKAARATMAKDAEARAEAMKEIQRFNQKNPTRRITPLNVLQSVRNRQKRIDQAEGGIYLPKNRRDAMDAGRFAVSE